jgi:hypothetical protein
MPNAVQTPEEKAAADAANKEQREQLAAEANKKRNDALLEARNAIADRADEIKDEEDDLVDLTDEVWAQEDGTKPKKTREQLIAEQDAELERRELEAAGEGQTEEEAAAALLRKQEREDRDADAAREAGADDARRRKDGTMEYRVEGEDGTETWLTVKELRTRAGDVGSGQGDEDGATTPPTRRDSPTAAQREQAQREAEERRQAERKVLRDKLIDLNTRASMGDETAINELADMQLDAITGDSGRLQRMVDERVDARVTGRTEFQKAVDWFESEDGYADVLTTPRLKAEAARLDVEAAKANPNMSPRQRLDQVGKQMRQLREDLGGAPRGTPPPRRETKVDRKRNAPQVPQAAGRQRPELEPDEQESTSDAIARMAKSRGQAHAIKH